MKFNGEEEERCPKTSPLTLTTTLKAPVENEEGEMGEKPTRKRKIAETKVARTRETKEFRTVTPIRNKTPTAIFDEGESSVDMGGFEADLEQPVLPLLSSMGYQLRLDLSREEKKVTLKRAQVQNSYLHLCKEVEEKGDLPLKTGDTLSC